MPSLHISKFPDSRGSSQVGNTSTVPEKLVRSDVFWDLTSPTRNLAATSDKKANKPADRLSISGRCLKFAMPIENIRIRGVVSIIKRGQFCSQSLHRTVAKNTALHRPLINVAHFSCGLQICDSFDGVIPNHCFVPEPS